MADKYSKQYTCTTEQLEYNKFINNASKTKALLFRPKNKGINVDGRLILVLLARNWFQQSKALVFFFMKLCFGIKLCILCGQGS